MSTPRVDLGPGRRTVRLAGDRLSGVLVTRSLLLALAAFVGCVVVFVIAIGTGDYPIPPERVIAILTGQEGGFPAMVVLEWRLPRAVGAAVFGAALAVSGALLQSLTRNPLGSPDILGFNAGAYTGALIAIGWFGGSLAVTTVSAFLGGIGAALLIVLLAHRRGVTGFRFLVIGIAVSSALVGLNTLLLLRMSSIIATVASFWGQGTLENLRWEQVGIMTAAITVVLGGAALLSPSMRQLELGDDVATATGVHRGPIRLGLLLASVTLTAIVTSVCGPIVFIALAAPHIARIFSAASGTSLFAAGAVGALLLSISDLVASRLLPVSLPAGVVTVVVGGAYLIWLIIREARRA